MSTNREHSKKAHTNYEYIIIYTTDVFCEASNKKNVRINYNTISVKIGLFKLRVRVRRSYKYTYRLVVYPIIINYYYIVHFNGRLVRNTPVQKLTINIIVPFSSF